MPLPVLFLTFTSHDYKSKLVDGFGKKRRSSNRTLPTERVQTSVRLARVRLFDVLPVTLSAEPEHWLIVLGATLGRFLATRFALRYVPVAHLSPPCSCVARGCCNVGNGFPSFRATHEIETNAVAI